MISIRTLVAAAASLGALACGNTASPLTSVSQTPAPTPAALVQVQTSGDAAKVLLAKSAKEAYALVQASIYSQSSHPHITVDVPIPFAASQDAQYGIWEEDQQPGVPVYCLRLGRGLVSINASSFNARPEINGSNQSFMGKAGFIQNGLSGYSIAMRIAGTGHPVGGGARLEIHKGDETSQFGFRMSGSCEIVFFAVGGGSPHEARLLQQGGKFVYIS